MSLPAGRQMAAALVACVTLAACAKKDATADSAAMAPDTTAMAPAPAATPAPAALTDANIVYMLDKANMLDSATGATAASKGTSADVKEYARMMMHDHHALREQGQALAKKLNVTPAAPADDQSETQMNTAMDMLKGAAKGPAFDSAYVADQIAYHQSLLQTATAAMGAAQNAELKDFIGKAAPAVQAHLDKAKAIQAKMMK